MSSQDLQQVAVRRASVVPAVRRGVLRITSYADAAPRSVAAGTDGTAQAAASTSFAWGLAGHDRALELAFEDLKAGSLVKARLLLERTREQRYWARRGYASAVFGATVRQTNVAETWASEESHNPDAWLLWARTAGVRALRAHDENAAPDVVDDLRKIAMRACEGAQNLCPVDPTPQVIMLSLDRLRYRAPLVAPERTGIRAPGPWDQLRRVAKLDQYNREAGHHLLSYFLPRYGGKGDVHQVAEWIATRVAPDDSPLKLLPIYTEIEVGPDPERVKALAPERERRVGMLEGLIEDARAGRGVNASLDPQRLTERITQLVAAVSEVKNQRETAYAEWSHAAARDLHGEWFGPGGEVPYVPVRDLSVLADVLHDAGDFEKAGQVLKFLSPYASAFPWSRRGEAEQVLAAVYGDCEVELPGGG